MTPEKPEWTLKRLLTWTSEYLGKVGVDQPRLCAEILLAKVLDCQRIELYTSFDRVPDEAQLAVYRDLVRRCREHEPVAYLVGEAHFYSLAFQVGPGVLVPRPETETLVTEALDFCRGKTRPRVDVLDLATGSGCIGIAIACNVVEAEVVASDISPEALVVAAANAETHELGPRFTLAQSDLFAQIAASGKAIFDLIVSNPPYISASAYQKLPENVRRYEPPAALCGGDDGLEILRRIAAEAEPFLTEEGMLMVETAYDQAPDVAELFAATDYLQDVTIVRDNLGHQRVVKARRR